MGQLAPVLHGAADLAAVGGEPGRDDAGGVLGERLPGDERGEELPADDLGGVPRLVVGADLASLGLLLLGPRAAVGGLGVALAAVADGLGVAEVVDRAHIAPVVRDVHAAAVQLVHLLRRGEDIPALGGLQVTDGHVRLMLGVLRVHDDVPAALVVGGRRLQSLAAGALVTCALQGVVEQLGGLLRGLDEGRPGLLVVVELDESTPAGGYEGAQRPSREGFTAKRRARQGPHSAAQRLRSSRRRRAAAQLRPTPPRSGTDQVDGAAQRLCSGHGADVLAHRRRPAPDGRAPEGPPGGEVPGIPAGVDGDPGSRVYSGRRSSWISA